MKRIFGLAWLLAAFSVCAAQEPVASASAAKDFLQRLDTTVQKGHALAKSGEMDRMKQHDHAVALKKLKDESEKFAALYSPYSECSEAAMDALASWQGLSADNYNGFTENHIGYIGAAGECSRALN